jgi:hypothetical protein
LKQILQEKEISFSLQSFILILILNDPLGKFGLQNDFKFSLDILIFCQLKFEMMVIASWENILEELPMKSTIGTKSCVGEYCEDIRSQPRIVSECLDVN